MNWKLYYKLGTSTLIIDKKSQEIIIYSLISQAYISQFYPIHEYEQTKVTVSFLDEIFTVTGKVIKKIAPNGFVLTISNDGKLVVTVSENDRKEISLHIWDTSTWLEKTAVKSDLLSFQSAAISPENDYLILSGHISDHTSVL